LSKLGRIKQWRIGRGENMSAVGSGNYKKMKTKSFIETLRPDEDLSNQVYYQTSPVSKKRKRMTFQEITSNSQLKVTHKQMLKENGLTIKEEVKIIKKIYPKKTFKPF